MAERTSEQEVGPTPKGRSPSKGLRRRDVGVEHPGGCGRQGMEAFTHYRYTVRPIERRRFCPSATRNPAEPEIADVSRETLRRDAMKPEARSRTAFPEPVDRRRHPEAEPRSTQPMTADPARSGSRFTYSLVPARSSPGPSLSSVLPERQEPIAGGKNVSRETNRVPGCLLGP